MRILEPVSQTCEISPSPLYKPPHCSRSFFSSTSYPAMAQVQTAPSLPSAAGGDNLPEYKSLGKVRSIPLVNDSLAYAHSIISANPYTAYMYNTSLGLGTTAFEYSKPVQARLAPIIDKADGVALMGIDAVESRVPYPFQTPTDEVSCLCQPFPSIFLLDREENLPRRYRGPDRLSCCARAPGNYIHSIT